MMNEKASSDYVAAALALHGITLDEARRAAVDKQFQLLNAMADKFLDERIPPDIEPAPIFRL